MKYNLTTYRTVFQFARQIGAQYQADCRIAPRNDGDLSPLECSIDPVDAAAVLADPIFDDGGEYGEFEEGRASVYDRIPCGAGYMSVYISPYGVVTPCVQLPLPCGDLNASQFSQIWRQSLEFDQVRSITISNLPACSSCKLLRHCRLCIGLAYVEEGSMTAPWKRACAEAGIMQTLGKRRR